MKKIIFKIEKQIRKLKWKIEKRYENFNSKTEMWQQSEYGEKYYDKTFNISLELEDLENVFEDLKKHI